MPHCHLAVSFRRVFPGSLLAFLLLLPALPLRAADSLKVVRKRPPYDNIASYTLQQRWRPEDEVSTLSPAGLFSNSSIFLCGTRFTQFLDDFGTGPAGMLGWSKWFTDRDGLRRWHGIRLGLGMGAFYDNYDASRIKSLDARLSYLFDLTSYADGYHPNRFFSFAPMAGLGFSRVDSGGSSFALNVLSAHLGVHIALQTAPGINLVMEPLLELQTDPRHVPRQNVWRKYIPAFRGNVGLEFDLERDYWKALDLPASPWRISLSAGPALQPAANIRQAQDLGKLIGHSLVLGLGRDFNGWLGLRVQAGLTRNHWFENRQDVYNRNLRRATLLFLRPEVTFDLPALFLAPEARWTRWRILLTAGPEMGLLHKQHVKNLSAFPYMGLSGGLQGRWAATPDLGIFLEPHLSAVSYSTVSNQLQVAWANYSDLQSSLMLGIEYNLASSRRRQQPSWAEAGPWYAFIRGCGFFPATTDYLSGMLLCAGAGKRVNRTWAVEGGLAGGAYIDALSSRSVREYELRISALYNFLPEEELPDVNLVAGLGLTGHQLAGEGIQWAPALQTGLSVSIPIFSGADLVVSPLLSLHTDTYAREKHDGFDFTGVFTPQMGLNFSLDRERWTRSGDPGEWRISAGGGIRAVPSSLMEKEATFDKSIGTVWSLALSRSILDFVDWRLLLGYGDSRIPLSGQATALRCLFLRMDAMADFLAMGAVRGRPVSLYGILGPELGLRMFNTDRHTYMGLAGGLQLKIRPSRHFAFYLETGASVIPDAVPLNLMLGVEFSLGARR